jgi:uncharacterized FlaG/YvyC family protein
MPGIVCPNRQQYKLQHAAHSNENLTKTSTSHNQQEHRKTNQWRRNSQATDKYNSHIQIKKSQNLSNSNLTAKTKRFESFRS